jgi:hypothetical protein
MKTEQEIADLLNNTRPELQTAITELHKCINESRWDMAIEWCVALQTGICVINVAEGILGMHD